MLSLFGECGIDFRLGHRDDFSQSGFHLGEVFGLVTTAITVGTAHAGLPLIQCWHKLARAQKHFELLDNEISVFLDSEPYPVVRSYDNKEFKYLYRIQSAKVFDKEHWALLIGDCVHNARSALDYIAWTLAGSDVEDRDTLFVIRDCSTKFEKSLWRLERIHGDAIAEIRKLQPYNRPYKNFDPLWLLEKLDVRDKHKLLTPIRTYSFRSTVGVYNPIHPDGTIDPELVGIKECVFAPDTRADDNTIIAELFLSGPSSTDPQVKVDAKFGFDISFERGVIAPSGNYSVRNYLREILRTIDNTISLFDRCISSHPNWLKS